MHTALKEIERSIEELYHKETTHEERYLISFAHWNLYTGGGPDPGGFDRAHPYEVAYREWWKLGGSPIPFDGPEPNTDHGRAFCEVLVLAAEVLDRIGDLWALEYDCEAMRGPVPEDVEFGAEPYYVFERSDISKIIYGRELSTYVV